MTKKQQQEAEIAIKKLLIDFTITERIKIIERIGKMLRQWNSMEINKEVEQFARKNGVKMDIDYTPILPKDNGQKK